MGIARPARSSIPIRRTGRNPSPVGVSALPHAILPLTAPPPKCWVQFLQQGMLSGGPTVLNRKRVIDHAAEHRLLAIYEADVIVGDGGLMSYGADPGEFFDRAVVVNLKTAKSIGLEIPPTLTALADEVIE